VDDRRVLPAHFGVSLGLTGLAGVWLFGAQHYGAPVVIGNAIAVVAAATLLILGTMYAREGLSIALSDFADPACGPFFASPVMAGLLLGTFLRPYARTASFAIVAVLLAAGFVLCGVTIGQWMMGGLDESRYGPAAYLPGAGVGFVGSQAAAVVGLPKLAWAFFGIGVVTWVFSSPIVFGRLNFRPRLAAALVPSLAIELTPPAVAGIAYFLMHPASDNVAIGIAAYCVLMVFCQAPLLPLYRRLTFTPSFWAFTFPIAASVGLGLRWIALERPRGGTVFAWALVVLATGIIGMISARSLWFITRAREGSPNGSRPAEQVAASFIDTFGVNGS
jgi:tellurite resistance protein